MAEMNRYRIKGMQTVVANTSYNVGVMAENAELGGFLEMDYVPVIAEIVAPNPEEAKNIANFNEIYGELVSRGPTVAEKPRIETQYPDSNRRPLGSF